mgnify:CR=1 FL=1
MQTEYECKILNIDVDKTKNLLKELGAEFIQEKNQRRYVYPISENSWLRLRDEKNKVTLTVKEIISNDIEGTKELEVNVNDFESTHLILSKVGITEKGYQENKRLSYKFNSCDIEIDFWPKLSPYLEIEGESKKLVESTVKLLGYTMQDVSYKSTMDLYRGIGIDLNKIKTLKF